MIYAVNIDNVKFDELSSFFDRLSSTNRKKVNNLINEKDKIRTALGELLVKYLLVNIKKMDIDQIKLNFTEYGKPFIDEKNIYFNISHSGGYVVCVINDSKIGIDIEKVKSIDFKVISKTYFSNEENNIISKYKGKKQLYYFYLLWTLRESYLKLDGRGLNLIDQISFSNINDDYQLLINGELNSRYKFFSLYFDNYVCSVCSSEKQSYDLKSIDIKNILNFYSLI